MRASLILLDCYNSVRMVLTFNRTAPILLSSGIDTITFEHLNQIQLILFSRPIYLISLGCSFFHKEVGYTTYCSLETSRGSILGSSLNKGGICMLPIVLCIA